MPPKRGRNSKTRTQSFYFPYMFRPIPLSLEPAQIDADVALMAKLLAAQRAVLERAAAARAELPAPAPAPAPPSPREQRLPASTPASMHQHPAQLAALPQQQRFAAAGATGAVPAPSPTLTSCTVQHQQAFLRQQLAGYALA